MTMQDDETAPELTRLNDNIAKIEDLSQRLVSAMSNKRAIRPSLQGPGQDLIMKAATVYVAEMMANPAKLIEHQVGYWGKALRHYVDAQNRLAHGQLQPADDTTPEDRRFADPLWASHPYFNFLKQQYLMGAEAMEQTVADLDGLDAREHQRITYFTQQVVDMLSPANFLATNPTALAKAVETEGESLVQGLENLVHDIEKNDGDLIVRLADEDAFEVGKNIATTEGAVVFRNRMFELIQYAPTTAKVHKTPLVIFPPWINKFYILDLKEKNSLIKWIVDQGYTLFVVSWVNPDESYADVGLDTYIEEGFLTALRTAAEISGEKEVNAIGYCIAGTTLSMTIALLKKRKEKLVKSATLFTTMTDFSDQGEFTAFLDHDFVDGIEAEARQKGMLESFFMARTFSYLRSNDLIYGPAIKSYMMGERPPAFDLLYWNEDGTNLPARMAIEYLRWLCQDDKFAKGEIELFGETLGLKDVTVPVCAIACETDHIAAWKSSFQGVRKMGSRTKTFILSESGHIAGIVNPPSKKKYGHYLNPDLKQEPEAWQEGAAFNQGSWWPTWEAWLAKRSGPKVPARKPGAKGRKVLAQAPGTYVKSMS